VSVLGPLIPSLSHFFDLDWCFSYSPFFFFNDTAPTEIYTLSLHDALPISWTPPRPLVSICVTGVASWTGSPAASLASSAPNPWRSEEHTSELQSPCNLVCRLLLEKKKKHKTR